MELTSEFVIFCVEAIEIDNEDWICKQDGICNKSNIVETLTKISGKGYMVKNHKIYIEI